jgi:hypothetical protein
METLLKAVGAIVVFIGLVALLAVLTAYPTKWVVNYLFTPGILTVLFGTAKIGFWQALALNFITGLARGTASATTKEK